MVTESRPVVVQGGGRIGEEGGIAKRNKIVFRRG
jgi:hypothetical protein